ncbi:MAG: hypothetical protein CBB68_04295 [Rhodospirillaceae bacterium TMED8]|nr:hypothetical protein [Magnetovibrio sp.]OUT51555.1 MAG: hypothetical protein CBB68_04295 [Rhodospirillaceae bacterium TMED8]|tara:strand:- start:715 stop:918 length:204 start_codon:yes stop_codon:yes gene_type:complete
MLKARYTPSRHWAYVFGLKFVLAIGFSTFGVLLEGVLFDLTGGFNAVFIILAGLALAGSAALLFLPD